MKLEAILLCDKVLREDNGKVHIQGIFDTISAKQLPAVHNELFLYFRFLVDASERMPPGEDVLSFQILQPDGTVETLPKTRANINEMGRVEGIFRFHRLPFPKWGIYTFRVSFNGVEVGTCSFRLNEIDKKIQAGSPTVH